LTSTANAMYQNLKGYLSNTRGSILNTTKNGDKGSNIRYSSVAKIYINEVTLRF